MAARFVTPEPSFMMRLQLLKTAHPSSLQDRVQGEVLDMEGDDEMTPKQMDKVKNHLKPYLDDVEVDL
jgi:hypothetical protein